MKRENEEKEEFLKGRTPIQNKRRLLPVETNECFDNQNSFSVSSKDVPAFMYKIWRINLAFISTSNERNTRNGVIPESLIHQNGVIESLIHGNEVSPESLIHQDIFFFPGSLAVQQHGNWPLTLFLTNQYTNVLLFNGFSQCLYPTGSVIWIETTSVTLT